MNIPVTAHRTQIYLTDDQYQKVKRLAHISDSTMANVIRDAVKQYPMTYAKDNHKTKAGRANDPFFTLDGFLRGPKDLSVKHDEYWDD